MISIMYNYNHIRFGIAMILDFTPEEDGNVLFAPTRCTMTQRSGTANIGRGAPFWFILLIFSWEYCH